MVLLKVNRNFWNLGGNIETMSYFKDDKSLQNLSEYDLIQEFWWDQAN
jgi:hypothetical protein